MAVDMRRMRIPARFTLVLTLTVNWILSFTPLSISGWTAQEHIEQTTHSTKMHHRSPQIIPKNFITPPYDTQYCFKKLNLSLHFECPILSSLFYILHIFNKVFRFYRVSIFCLLYVYFKRTSVKNEFLLALIKFSDDIHRLAAQLLKSNSEL